MEASTTRGELMIKSLLKSRRGFTLIELMIVMTIVGILASIAVPNYRWGLIKAREAVLRENLYTLRTTIDQFFADQGKFPDTLQELVSKNYLPGLPKDPFTKDSEWTTVAPPTPSDGSKVEGNVADVHSHSNLVGTNNVPYNEW
jgi:general secretion pathway protein G